MVMRVTLGGSFIKRNFGLVFGGIWLVVGTPLLVGGIAMWIQEHRFAHDALTVEGKVLTRDIHTAHNRNSTGSATSTQYQVSYRFLAPDGITREGRSNVDVHLWENLHEQGPVTISYLPGDPAANRVAGKPDWVGPVILAGLGGFFSIAGGSIVIVSLGKRLSRGRLLHSGMAAEATVTAVESTNFSVNNVPQWIIRYRYKDYRGRGYQGKSPYLSPQEANAWKKGDSGKIKYDREHSDKSLWVGGE
jgi:hypothetical protein